MCAVVRTIVAEVLPHGVSQVSFDLRTKVQLCPSSPAVNVGDHVFIILSRHTQHTHSQNRCSIVLL
eukprot:m.251651 g.251651  ORF g.251651 m.251651 type:complete len:66 (+) comp15457_c0_seq5:4184-4381(+)